MWWNLWRRKKEKQKLRDSAEMDADKGATPKHSNMSAHPFNTSGAAELLGLQRLIGNQAVLRMVKPTSVLQNFSDKGSKIQFR